MQKLEQLVVPLNGNFNILKKLIQSPEEFLQRHLRSFWNSCRNYGYDMYSFEINKMFYDIEKNEQFARKYRLRAYNEGKALLSLEDLSEENRKHVEKLMLELPGKESKEAEYILPILFYNKKV